MGYTPTQIYDHIKNSFLLAWDISCEVTKTKEDIKVVNNHNEIVQVYYKIKNTVDTLITLNQIITDDEIIRQVI